MSICEMSNITLVDLFLFCRDGWKFYEADQYRIDANYLHGIEFELDFIETFIYRSESAAKHCLDKVFDHTRDVTIVVNKTLPILKHICHLCVNPKELFDIVV